MEQPIVIRFRWTAEELLRAEDFHSRQVCGSASRILTHFSVAVLSFAGVVSLIGGRAEHRTLAIVFIVGGACWFVLRPVARRLMARHQLAVRPAKDAEVEW